jgi:hypothetical protein
VIVAALSRKRRCPSHPLHHLPQTPLSLFEHLKRIWHNARLDNVGHPMLLQTNSYIVPKEKRAEHARLLLRFRQTLARLGCDHFEVYEQVGSNWAGGETTGRFVQIMRFRDRKQQQAMQAAERTDPQAQALIKEFCDLINFPYQQQQGLFAVGFYHSALAVAPSHVPAAMPEDRAQAAKDEAAHVESGNGQDALSENPSNSLDDPEPAPSASSDPSVPHS